MHPLFNLIASAASNLTLARACHRAGLGLLASLKTALGGDFTVANCGAESYLDRGIPEASMEEFRIVAADKTHSFDDVLRIAYGGTPLDGPPADACAAMDPHNKVARAICGAPGSSIPPLTERNPLPLPRPGDINCDPPFPGAQLPGCQSVDSAGMPHRKGGVTTIPWQIMMPFGTFFMMRDPDR